jgi:hypothetical protein
VLHTAFLNAEKGQLRKGWAFWDGLGAAATSACLFSDNIDADTFRSLDYRPFMGRIATSDTSLIWKMDTGHDDNGVDFHAHLRTKPMLRRSGMHKFDVKSGVLMAAPAAGVSVDVAVLGNFAEDDNVRTSAEVDLTPAGGETSVIRILDDLNLGDLRSVQVDIQDVDDPTGQWVLELLAFSDSTAGKAV